MCVRKHLEVGHVRWACKRIDALQGQWACKSIDAL